MPDGLRSPTTTYPGRRPRPPRPYTGFGTAREAGAHHRRLIAGGTTTLPLVFDLPTRLGLDSDAPLARGEVGRSGVAVDSLDDMRVLLDGVPLDEVTTSMAVNAPAAPLLLLYQLVAEERGVPAGRLTGAVHNDVLGDLVVRGACVLPPRPALRLTADVLAYSAAELPAWQPISISGRPLAEAGASPAQELAFTLANGIAYVRAAVAAGVDAAALAPVLDEIAKFHTASPDDRVEAHARELMREIEERGGAVAALEQGFQQRQIDRHAFRAAQEGYFGRRAVLGSGQLPLDEWEFHEPPGADPAVAARQAERLAKLRAWRDPDRIDVHVTALREAARGRDNVLYPMKEALAAGATVGEICDALRETWGSFPSPDPTDSAAPGPAQPDSAANHPRVFEEPR
ncbi:methylmalonyl-CoA mutase family protein [Streptomyces sp. NPDC088387]|uniref:methylmalonyl-CoA mutase family protein n=1 Tax=Streptomyces sp. NPDC088387 TaxID=3365859 RepID=UPI00380163F4